MSTESSSKRKLKPLANKLKLVQQINKEIEINTKF